MGMQKVTKNDFVEYLEETLISDLIASGSAAIANDLRTCLQFILNPLIDHVVYDTNSGGETMLPQPLGAYIVGHNLDSGEAVYTDDKGKVVKADGSRILGKDSRTYKRYSITVCDAENLMLILKQHPDAMVMTKIGAQSGQDCWGVTFNVRID